MTDIQQQTTTAGSSYSIGSIKYWCGNCRRQFSQLKLENSISQARCPRCNLFAEELPPNTNASSNRTNTHNQQQQQQQQQRPTQSGPNLFYTQTFMDPFGRVFVQRVPVNNNTTMETENDDTHQHSHNHNRGANNNIFSQFFGGAFDSFFGFGSAFPGFGFGAPVDESVIEEFLRNDPNQYGPPPAPEEAINKLQEVKFDANEGSEITCCPICQEDYKQGESLVRLPCKHDYHKGCVNQWLNKHNSCPMCRQAI